ncbi:NVEALA domain-containing protein, partial [uncultured Bacteroides sp.]
AGYGIYANQKGTELSDLALSNVEALANDDEWGTGFNCRWIDELYLHCWPWGTGLGCPCYM